MANRLAGETSPYLLQHKDNPVEWYPWGPEALQRARDEDTPILLSIGYSACHWCHVMEHESFEDPNTAQIMNSLFVNIKVDREERPDLDSIYMQAVQAMTGHGGWPMTVFLTPEGRPFYGGTYFPPEDRFGMPSFRRLLLAVAEAYRTQRVEVLQNAGELLARLQSPASQWSGELLNVGTLERARERLGALFDPEHGGLGSAPKFPQPMGLEFLLRCARRFQDPQALHVVEFTLTKMARGGIYDQVGGGFHRYSTDAQWLVPHFEKMLYDNALSSRLYLHAHLFTRKPLYRRIAEETLDYVLREMTDPAGGFYSTQDADSEGHEGKFFLWSPQEIVATLGEPLAKALGHYFGVTGEGNFEGLNILYVPKEAPEVAGQLGIDEQELMAMVEEGKGRLYRARAQRVSPGRDEKVLTAWNGLMLRSFAEAAAALGREDYLKAAVANATFLLEQLRRNGRLLRSYKDGEARLLGFLEDYSLLADGLVALYEVTFQRRWLDEARALTDAMIDLFWEEKEGVFYDTGRDHEPLIIRPRDTSDSAMPCGSSVACDVLLRLGVLTGEAGYAGKAARGLCSVASLLPLYPSGFGHWLGALDFYLSRPQEIAVAGPLGAPETRALLDVVFQSFLPNKVIAGWDPASGPEAARGLPLLEGRPLIHGHAAAYLCENYTCRLPATRAEVLASQLGLERSPERAEPSQAQRAVLPKSP